MGDMLMSGDAPPNEFSRILALDPRRGAIRIDVAADPQERAALAERFGLQAIEALSAAVQIRQRPGQRWRLAATLQARVVQTCVVTLEAVAQGVEDRIVLDFAAAQPKDAPDLDLSDEDAEPLPDDGRIDVGEIVAQHLYLALDPFPRAPGAAWPADATDAAQDAPAAPQGRDEPAQERRPSPFAALAARGGRGSGQGSGET
jgi:uncharacterized metal-binding protein YceD (DUF177 family)